MKTWQRYMIGLLVLIWLLGIAPTWIWLGTYTSHNRGYAHPVHWGLWWTISPLLAPGCAAALIVALIGLRELVRWVIGPRRVPESAEFRAQRIARLERELGIGQDE